MVFSAVIVAGGSGERFGRKKQFIELAGIPVLKRTVLCFDAHEAVDRIVVVVPEEDIPQTRGILSDILTGIIITKGGMTRQESVMNGLVCAQDSKGVLIHDGVRPFISPRLMKRVMAGLEGFDGCIPALEVTDTIKEVGDNRVLRTISRKGLFQVQTPQAFITDTLIKAHISAGKTGVFTDDSAVLEASGKNIRVVQGDPLNVKITFQDDLVLAEAILRCHTASA